MKRCFFSIPLLLFLLFSPLKANAVTDEPLFNAAPETLFASPGDPVTAEELTRLFGGTSASLYGPLNRGQFCCWLNCWLDEQNLILDARCSGQFDDVLRGDRFYLDIQYITEGGVMGGRDGMFRSEEPLTAGEVALALRRVRDVARTRSNDQPCDTLPSVPAEPIDSLDGCCMLGHSNVVGINFYVDSPLDCAALNGISADAYMTSNSLLLRSGMQGTVYDALSLEQYRRTYIMLGTNDFHQGQSGSVNYKKHMTALVKLVKEMQPETDICLLAITPLGYDQKSIYPYHSQSNIRLFNEVQKDLARREGIAYLDIFTPVCSRSGFMRAPLARDDGVHFSPEGYQRIIEILLTHPTEQSHGETQ